MRSIKAYAVGIFVPCTTWFLLYTTLYFFDNEAIKKHPVQVVSLLTPILWGAWNAIFLNFGKYFRGKTIQDKITLAGFIFGIITGAITAFIIPLFLYLLGGGYQYATLIFFPFYNMLCWRYLVHPMNKAFKIY